MEGLPEVHIAEEAHSLDGKEDQEEVGLQTCEGPWALASGAGVLGCHFLKGKVISSWISFLPRSREGTWNLGHCGLCFPLPGLGHPCSHPGDLERGQSTKQLPPSTHGSIWGIAGKAWGPESSGG